MEFLIVVWCTFTALTLYFGARGLLQVFAEALRDGFDAPEGNHRR